MSAASSSRVSARCDGDDDGDGSGEDEADDDDDDDDDDEAGVERLTGTTSWASDGRRPLRMRDGITVGTGSDEAGNFEGESGELLVRRARVADDEDVSRSTSDGCKLVELRRRRRRAAVESGESEPPLATSSSSESVVLCSARSMMRVSFRAAAFSERREASRRENSSVISW